MIQSQEKGLSVTLNEFLKGSDLFLTLANEQGEKYEAGKVNYVKPLNSKTVLRWHVDGKYSNNFPFTYAILHGAKKVFNVSFIRPILPDTEKILEFVY